MKVFSKFHYFQFNSEPVTCQLAINLLVNLPLRLYLDTNSHSVFIFDILDQISVKVL